MANEYFVEHKEGTTFIDFFLCEMRLVQIPISLEYNNEKIDTPYSVSIWIPNGMTKIDPDLPPLLFNTNEVYQLYFDNLYEIQTLFNSANLLNCTRVTEDNRVEITLVEKMKIRQLEIAEVKDNRWMIYSPTRFPSTKQTILDKMAVEMRG